MEWEECQDPALTSASMQIAGPATWSAMIPVTELYYFADIQPAYHFLKPWWDIFTDYISIVMLIIAMSRGHAADNTEQDNLPSL